jgi:hypothetical protein
MMDVNSSRLTIAKALDEISGANKDVSKTFVFRNGEIFAKSSAVSDSEARKTVAVFEAVASRSSVIGNVRSLSVQGLNGRVDITDIDEYYLAIVASKDIDDGKVENFNHSLEPAIFKIINESPQSTELPEENSPEISSEKEPPEANSKTVLPPLEDLAPDFPETSYAEFIVGDMRGIGILSGSNESVRLDVVTVGHWTELYGENKIQKILLKEKSGKTVECSFEVSYDPKQRGLVSIPEPILRKLQIKKGVKIFIKPVIPQETQEEPSLENEEEQIDVPVKKPRFLPDSPACQLIVEDVSSFGDLTGSDLVRFDDALAQRWREFCGDRKIEEVTVTDAVSGKAVRCKFKIVKDEKFSGKGLIQVPKAIRKELSVKEGSLVIVKPVLW